MGKAIYDREAMTTGRVFERQIVVGGEHARPGLSNAPSCDFPKQGLMSGQVGIGINEINAHKDRVLGVLHKIGDYLTVAVGPAVKRDVKFALREKFFNIFDRRAGGD